MWREELGAARERTANTPLTSPDFFAKIAEMMSYEKKSSDGFSRSREKICIQHQKLNGFKILKPILGHATPIFDILKITL